MNRRGFLGAITAALGGAVLDPERALWVPGAKLISIPAPRALVTTGWGPTVSFGVGDIITFSGLYVATGKYGPQLQKFVVQARQGGHVELVPQTRREC